jgi:hypothetical protein
LGKNADTANQEDTPVSLDDLMTEIRQLRQEQADNSGRLAALEQHVKGSKKGE